MKNKKAYLVLADGTVFNGISMGKEGTALGEVVFNTCTASYGELLSDPTYYGQIVAQTYPLVGNRGVEKRENGSKIMASGYVVREWCDTGDLGEETLDSYLKECGIVGISGNIRERIATARHGGLLIWSQRNRRFSAGKFYAFRAALWRG